MKNWLGSKLKKYMAQTVIVLGAVLIFIGLANGEIYTVFSKAINICMECIGIG